MGSTAEAEGVETTSPGSFNVYSDLTPPPLHPPPPTPPPPGETTASPRLRLLPYLANVREVRGSSLTSYQLPYLANVREVRGSSLTSYQLPYLVNVCEVPGSSLTSYQLPCQYPRGSRQWRGSAGPAQSAAAGCGPAPPPGTRFEPCHSPEIFYYYFGGYPGFWASTRTIEVPKEAGGLHISLRSKTPFLHLSPSHHFQPRNPDPIV
jgi:hypothetical protein